MSVYKEIGHFAHEVADKSKRIYKDAADFGVPIKTIDDPLVKQLKFLIEMYRMDVKTEKYSTGSTQTIKFDGGYPAVVEAGFEKATFTYVTTRNNKEMKGYLYVETHTSKEAKIEARKYQEL